MAAGTKGNESDPGLGAFTTIGVTVGARNELATFCEKNHNMAIREVATSLIEWFAAERPIVQQAILGAVAPGMEVPWAEALERMAKELRARARGIGLGGEFGTGTTPEGDSQSRESERSSNGAAGETQQRGRHPPGGRGGPKDKPHR